MSALLVCLSDYPADLVQQWAGGARVVIADRTRPVEVLADLLPQAEVIIADAARALPLTAATVATLQRCRTVIVPAVGVDGAIDAAAAQAHGISVVNMPGYNAQAVADWTVWALLDGIRRPIDIRQQDWSVARPLGTELSALTIGLLGYGAIGQAVEQRLRAFGSTVLHTRSRPPTAADHPHQVDLETLFATCDVVSLHAPLTDATRGIVTGELLGSMPVGAGLINSARGGLVIEDDLVAALRAGKPAWAALDVFATEPLPTDHPFRNLGSVRLTPHIAAATLQARRRVRERVGAAVAQALATSDGQRSP